MSFRGVSGVNKMYRSIPTANLEYFILSRGHSVIGIDEVGRGSLAGPVVAAVVLITEFSNFELIRYIRDSKSLTPKKRQEAYNLITKAYKYAIGSATCKEIDRYGIRYATYMAMQRAFLQLVSVINMGSYYILVDGKKTVIKLPLHNVFYYSYGDSKVFSIAAASIVAKVYRDKLLNTLHKQYPFYNWKRNKGYGTKEHKLAIKKYGRSPYHRMTFLSNI